MTGAARWPLHPQPGAGEALSSWLIRVADAYGMTLGQLVRHNLGPASFELGDQNLSDPDMEPPPGMLEVLQERTGVPRDQLARMTIAGWVPWILDTLDPTQGTAAFETYVQQDSVILPPGRAVKRDLPTWRAWLPDRPMMRRACPRCIDDANGETAVFTLASRIPLTIGCPKHGYRLEAMFGSLGTFIAWEDGDMVPTPTDPRVAAMDRRTHEGLAKGTVSLSGRPVHVGVWFRLLRTLLDEVNTPTSTVPPSSRSNLHQVWQAIGRPPRAGQVRWQPYECLDWPTQQAMLHAAAAAIDLIETGRISAAGTLAPLLHAQQHPAVYDGDPPHHRIDPAPATTVWQAAMTSIRDVIGIARHDAGTARQLLALLTCYTPNELAYSRIRGDLIETGIPSELLPTRDQADCTT